MAGGGPALGLAVFLGLGGLVAGLAGRAGLGEIRRLRLVGVRARALVRDGSSVRPLLQFTDRDGRIVEVVSPVPPCRRVPLLPGSEVGIRYDPADPRAVLLDGRERRWLERAFVGVGAAVVLGAALLALLAG